MGIYDNFEIHTLENNLKYVLIPNNHIKSFSFYVFVKVGSRDENEKNRGSSHLLEHMLFKGTNKRPSYKIINKELDYLGGMFNAFTTKNITGYFIKAPSKLLEKSIDILSDLLFNSLIRLEEIEKEKQVVIEELSRMLDNNDRYSLEIAFKMALKNHPLEHLVIGTKKHIENYSRQDIIKYYKKYYNPSNMCISVCGNFGKNIHTLIRNSFMPETKSKYINPIPKIALKIQNIPRINVLKKQNNEQTSISITFPTCNMYDIKNTFICQIISNIFGGGVSSRLYEEIREKEALAYSVSVDCEFFQDAGIFYMVTGVDKDSLFENNNLKNSNGALFVLLNELNKLAKGVKEDELKRVKETIIRKLIVQQEDSSTIAEFYGYQLVYDKSIINIEESEKMLNNINLKDVNNMCYELFDFSKMNISIIGNYEKKTVIDYVYDKFH